MGDGPHGFPDGSWPRLASQMRPTDGSSAIPIATDGGVFRVETHVDSDETVIELHGEGDLTTAPFLSRALTHARSNRHQQIVVLDLSQLGFLDASFLAVIARHRRCEDIHRIVLRSPTPFVARILDVVGWNDLIDRRYPTHTSADHSSTPTSHHASRT
jgi:anti-anti-sigma factor